MYQVLHDDKLDGGIGGAVGAAAGMPNSGSGGSAMYTIGGARPSQSGTDCSGKRLCSWKTLNMHLEQPHAHPLTIQKCVRIRPVVDDVHVPGRIVGAGVAMGIAGAPGGGGGGGDARHITGGA